MMVDLAPEVEQRLANLSDGEWAALSARVRAPDAAAAFADIAAKHLPAEQLEVFMKIANPAAFVGDGGEIDKTKVARHLSTLFGHEPADWGQHNGTPVGSRPGDAGRAEAAMRFGTERPTDVFQPAAPGAGGRAEAQRRFGNRGGRQP